MRWYIDRIQKKRNITTIAKYRWNEAKKQTKIYRFESSTRHVLCTGTRILNSSLQELGDTTKLKD